MKLLDFTLPTPQENLAYDEGLLDACEEKGGEEILRFWESPDYFVVLGRSSEQAVEVDMPSCKRRNIPVLRRSSGGCSVLQGPGCLNYSLILKINGCYPLSSIRETNRFIMERHKISLEQETGSRIEIQGYTDLALAGKKFSGNAQRRKRNALLFHGTFLFNFDIQLVSSLLLMPLCQPAYRQNRSHAEFLTNINVSSLFIKYALTKTWITTD